VRAGVTLAQGAPPSREEALARGRARLERAGIASAERDAEWLLLHALGITRAALWAEPRAALTPEQAGALAALLERRARREPLQLLLGEVPFHDARLAVEPGVLVPRPETEALVEAVLEALQSAAPGVPAQVTPAPGEPPASPARASGRRLLDWGTGSGAIAIALLRALPGWSGVAADKSRAALALAARNAAWNGVAGRLRLVAADFTAVDSAAGALLAGSPEPEASGQSADPRFDLVVSNPPYVRRGDIPGLMPEVRDHDPVEALDGGADGLDAHRHLARGLTSWLRPGGLLALEIGADQADEVLGLFAARGARLTDARILPDWAGKPRILIGTLPGEEA